MLPKRNKKQWIRPSPRHSPRNSNPLPRAAPGDDPMAKLQQLVDMKTQGLLSDDEFTAAKAKLLA